METTEMRAKREVLAALGLAAMTWVACAHDHEDERARCPDSVVIRSSSPTPARSALVGQPGPDIGACQTPFALVEAAPGQKDCALPAAESASWTLVPATRGFDGRAHESGLAEIRRTRVSDPGFCVFEWTDRQKHLDPAAFARIQAQPDCPLTVGLGGGLGSALDVAPSFEVPSYVWLPLTRTFDRQARGLGAARWQKLYEAHLSRPKIPVRVAVVDATSNGVTAPDRSKHGFAVSRLIGSLFCDDSGSAECEKRVVPHIALPMLDVRRRDYVNGGFFGNFHQLFDALTDALHAWDPAREHLVINLGLGFIPSATTSNEKILARVTELLERASCQGALVVAGAGDLAAAQGPTLPAALESTRAPDAARCDALGFPWVRAPGTPPKVVPGSSANRQPATADYSPLVHAVGALDARDQRTQIAREWSQPRLAAYGLGVVAGGSASLTYTPPMSGTSMATAVVSGIAASVWSARSELTADEVMALVYRGGVELDGGARSKRARTAFCVDQPFGPCDAWKVRRAVLCGALALALPQEKLTCASGDDDGPVVFPELPEKLAPPLTGDAPVACLLPRCGVAIGPAVARIPRGTLGQAGAASCATCVLSKHFGGSPYALLWGYPTEIPPNLRFTIVTAYSSSGEPRSYLLANPTTANALYTGLMRVPDDTFYAVIDWVFSLGAHSVVDTTEVIVGGAASPQ